MGLRAHEVQLAICVIGICPNYSRMKATEAVFTHFVINELSQILNESIKIFNRCQQFVVTNNSVICLGLFA